MGVEQGGGRGDESSSSSSWPSGERGDCGGEAEVAQMRRCGASREHVAKRGQLVHGSPFTVLRPKSNTPGARKSSMGKISLGGERGGATGTTVLDVKSLASGSGNPLYSCLNTTLLECKEGSQHIFLLVLVFLGASTQESCSAWRMHHAQGLLESQAALAALQFTHAYLVRFKVGFTRCSVCILSVGVA